jgi:micrococcal nuclease
MRAKVARVDEADGLVLEQPLEGATVVRLAGIDAPRPRTSSATPAELALLEQGRAALVELAEHQVLCLSLPQQTFDRYGRLLAQVVREDGLWLQGQLLRQGLARVHTTLETRARAQEMLAIESAARKDGLGLWRSAAFRVHSAPEAARFIGGFQLVEGKVLTAARRKDRWYLNFGDDWRDDFTVSVGKEALPRFAEQGFDLYALQGKVIRVRGWLEKLNGPMIEVNHPEQIEILAEPAG